MAKHIFAEDYTLCKSNNKGVIVALSVNEEITPSVTLYKLGGHFIELNESEWGKLVENEALVGSYFLAGALVSDKSSLMLSDKLVIKFDNLFDSKMVVLQRLDDPAGLRHTTLWFTQRTWDNLFTLLPLLQHLLQQRKEWVPAVQTVANQIAAEVVLKHKNEIQTGPTMWEFNKLLKSTIAIENYDKISNTKNTMFDGRRCAFDLMYYCCENILMTARRSVM